MPLTESDLAAIEAAVATPRTLYWEGNRLGTDGMVPLAQSDATALLADLRAAYSTINEQDEEIARLKNRLEQANVEPD